MSEIITTDGKFKKLDSDQTIQREKKLQNYLRSLHKKIDGIKPEVYRRIIPCGSKSGVMYGLPKIHKEGSPIRPIISAVGTYNYKLAKYLDEILKPLLDNSKYILKDTFDFVNKIKSLSTSIDKILASYDVQSLFTNIPTIETIEIILNEVFKDGIQKFHDLNRRQLKKLLVICIQESHFQFNGEFYDQVDGVAMGSPLGPLFANIFMKHFEEKNMKKLEKLGLIKYFRYVDDIFATVGNRKDAESILDLLNKQHPNIKFTIEHEKDNQLPFLDTVVKRRIGQYITTVYRKKTFTGVYLNWTSLTARKYKIGLIKGLLNRICRICTTDQDRSLEIDKLKHILILNEYPKVVVDKVIEEELKKENGKEKVEKDIKRYIVLPYVGPKSDEFSDKLKGLINSNFPQIDFNVAFQTPQTIGSFFPYKDKVKEAQAQSLVVYKIKCDTCNAEYIGKTERILHHRIKEHKTGNTSSCFQHVLNNPGHKINYDGIEIVDRADNNMKLQIKELLHILKQKPILNKQLNSQSNFDIKTIIVKAYQQFREEK